MKPSSGCPTAPPFLAGVGVLLLTLLLTACAGLPERLWLNAPGWSRAQWVGHTQTGDPVPIATDGEGRLYLLLTGGREDRLHPRVIALDRRAEVLWDRTYEAITLKWLDQPRLLWSGEGLHLFWLSDWRLYHARLTADGELLEPPALLSGEVRVGAYDVASDSEGRIAVWYSGSRRSPGLYALPPDNPEGEPTLMDPEGIRPDLQYDAEGTLHSVWLHYPPGYGTIALLYAAYPRQADHPVQPVSVREISLGVGGVLEGPRLGVSQEGVYLFWTVIVRTGMEAGRAETSYVHFPPGQPDRASPAQALTVPADYHLTYRPFPGGELKAGDRVPWGTGQRGVAYVTEVAVVPSPGRELAIAFHARLPYLMRKERGQVGLLFFQQGAPVAYQLLSFTSVRSEHPALSRDSEGYLYATWLEGREPSGFPVYLAGTAPEMRSALRPLTPEDVGRLSVETLFGLLTGALLFPLIFVWLIPPMLLLGLTSAIWRREERLLSPGVLISLTLALAAYWAGKLAILPGIRHYVPFSAWIPFIPPWLAPILRWGVPPLLTGLAFLTAWGYTYRRQQPSLLFFLFIYAAVDGVLTLAVYGVLVYAAF